MKSGSGAFTLFPDPAGWRIGVARAGGPALSDPMPDVPAAVNAMRAAGYDGGGVLLAIPAGWCLAAPIATDGLPTKDRRRAMTYRLEEKLPVAAEEVVADFVPSSPTARFTFGVCARVTGLRDSIHCLESAGVAVAVVSPASLLALQRILAAGDANGVDAVVCATDDEEELELFTLRDRLPDGWYLLPNEAKDLLTHLALALPAAATDVGRSLWVWGELKPSVASALAGRPELRVVQRGSPSPRLAVTSLADAVLGGSVTPWIDLRRDAVAVGDRLRHVRTPLTCAVVAIACGVLCAAGAMLWRATRYDDLSARLAGEQRVEYRRAFPDAPVPDDVPSRLASEERNLRGLSGDAVASVTPPRDACGLIALRDLLTHLPAPHALRYRVLELNLNDGRFTLEGQVPAHGDADAIAAALRQGGEFDVEPPRTERVPGPADGNSSAGVTFTVSGRAAPPRRAAR